MYFIVINWLKFKMFVSVGKKVFIVKIICVGMYFIGKFRINVSEMFIKSF